MTELRLRSRKFQKETEFKRSAQQQQQKIFLSSEGNQQFRGRGRGADAPTEQQSKTPRTQDNATRTGESGPAHVNRGTR